MSENPLSANLSPQTAPTLLGTDEASQAIPARPQTHGRNLPGRAPNGTADYETLPHRCGRCDNRWSGNLTCHCGACHRTFGGVGNFDRHRRNGECLEPAAIGLSLLSGRAYECWGDVQEVAE